MTRWLLIALVGVFLLGCGDTFARRENVAAELNAHADRFKSNKADLASLNKIIDVLENGPYPFDRTYACGVLRELGPAAKTAVPALVAALNCGDLTVEREAPRSLGAMGQDAAEAVPALTANLLKTDRDAGWFSADALGSIGLPALGSIPNLEAATNCDCDLMVESAEQALKRLRKIETLKNAE